jgi:hypothetical protein
MRAAMDRGRAKILGAKILGAKTESRA